jgi:hypothetical protein
MAAFIKEVKAANRAVHDVTSKPPRTIEWERLRQGRPRESVVGRQNLQLPRGAYKRRRDATPVGESFRNSASLPYAGDRPRPCHSRARIQLFQAFAAPFSAVLLRLTEARGKGTPALPAATARRPVERAEESAGDVLFVLARLRAPGPKSDNWLLCRSC